MDMKSNRISLFVMIFLVSTIFIGSIPTKNAFADHHVCYSPGDRIPFTYFQSNLNPHHWDIFLISLPVTNYNPTDFNSLVANAIVHVEQDFGTGSTFRTFNGFVTMPSSPAGDYRLVVFLETFPEFGGFRGVYSTLDFPSPCPPFQDFTISLFPSSRTVQAGSGTSFTIDGNYVQPVAPNADTQLVTYSASGLPSGANINFNLNNVPGSYSFFTSITTSSSTPSGTFPITITGTSPSVSHSATFQLTVTPPPDNDGDGFGVSDGDCNDNDNSVYPGAPELIDGKDNDCNGALLPGELDDDGDGIFNANDSCPADPNNDADADGICGDVDNCPADPNNDADADGICGDVDNCPAIPNSTQANVDGDTLGDACDPDSDNDGVFDIDDAEPLNPFVCQDSDADSCDDCSSGFFDVANDGLDTDADLVCDAGDADDDNDGVLDGDDNAPTNRFLCSDSDADSCDDCSVTGSFTPSNDGLDTDSDGMCNVGDTDDDNDGVDDSSDAEPLNPFVCQDSDADSCDDCSSGFFDVANDGLDTDADLMCDAGDADDDNDGINDDVDPLPIDNSNNDFSDGTTNGFIISGQNFLTISDDTDGVRIVSLGDAATNVCDGSAVATFTSGDDAVVTCGSVTIEVISGPVDVEFVTGGVPATTSLNSGDSITFDPDTLQVTNSGAAPATITIGGLIIIINPGTTEQIDIIPPEFNPISNIVADATSLDGAIVNYALPTATDNIDPSPTVVCIPSSGSLFPLGDNTVSCTASDLVGNTANASFIITIQITFDSLEDKVVSFDLKKGIATSLIKKLEAASASFDNGQIKPSTNQLHAFINEVNAQDGKALTGEQAEILRNAAELLISHISS